MNTKLIVGVVLFIVLLLGGALFLLQESLYVEEFIPPDHFVYYAALENNQTIPEFCDGDRYWNENVGNCIDLGINFSCDYLKDAKYRVEEEYNLKDICHYIKAVHLNSSESYAECAKISDEISAGDCEIAVTPGGCFVSREHYGSITSLFPIYFFNNTINPVAELGVSISRLLEPCKTFPEITQEEIIATAQEAGMDSANINRDMIEGVNVDEFATLAQSEGYNINHYCKDLENFDNCMHVALKYNFDFLDCEYFSRFDNRHVDICNFLKGMSTRRNADFCYEITDEFARDECVSMSKYDCLVSITEEQSKSMNSLEIDGETLYQIGERTDVVFHLTYQSEILKYVRDVGFDVQLDLDFCTSEI